MFMLNYWKPMAFALLIAFVAGIGYKAGANTVQQRWDADRAMLAEAKLAAVEQNQKAITNLQVIKNENLAQIDKLSRDNHALWLRLPKQVCGSASTASGGADTTPSDGELREDPEIALNHFAAGLADEAARADKIVEQCRVVMEWAKSSEMK